MTIYIPITYYLNGGAKTLLEQAVDGLNALNPDSIDNTDIGDIRFFITSSYNNNAIKGIVNWCDVFYDSDINTVVFRATERFIKNYKRG